MGDIWFISDTHFNHLNFLRFQDDNKKYIRPFKSVEEMNETIIDRWNSVVKSGDKVYHLGDVYFGNKEDATKIFQRLNGKKRLIVGNHDNILEIVSLKLFQKIQMWRMFPEYGILLTHVPVHESTLTPKKLINIHGHIHQNKTPIGPYYNVSVEVQNYTPIHLDQIRTVT
jgi:calcineurin-like phosphoesterase family protein